MMSTTEEKGFEELQRIVQIFQQQREELNAEAQRVSQRLTIWHARRESIDDALLLVKQRLLGMK